MKKYGVMLPRLRKKPATLMHAIARDAKAKGLSVTTFKSYQPCEVLILYGWGGAEQQKAIKAHSGPYVALDLGYWERMGLVNRKWRVSINGFHCPDRIMAGPSPRSTRSKGIVVHSDQKNDGHILLIGSGPKSCKVGAQDWSSQMCKRLREKFPGKPIKYRPKPNRPEERNVRHDGLAAGDLALELSRASLVVCRHSNVAVDACIAGVPVVCEDGAAASIYPKLENWQDQPDFETRKEFIHRLGWWQWSIQEVRQGKFWDWLLTQV